MKTQREVEKTTVCPCGHIHKLPPNPNGSVYCGQCNCDYDRQNRIWRDSSTGDIIEENTRLVTQKRGIEYGDYC